MNKEIHEKTRLPLVDSDINDLGSFLNVCKTFIQKDSPYWFRGNASEDWKLEPSALRYSSRDKISVVDDLIHEFKRYSEFKLDKPPREDDTLKWMQLAQHYGLPTCLLDWTKNALIALYFACQRTPQDTKPSLSQNGVVYMFNPLDSNRLLSPDIHRVLDPYRDKEIIEQFLKTKTTKRKSYFIAIEPILNSPRIMLQQGVFTLHAKKIKTGIWNKVVSMIGFRIKERNKQSILEELNSIGLNEMAIYPEIEHVCNYLKWKCKL